MSKLTYFRNAFHEAEAKIHAKYSPVPDFSTRNVKTDFAPMAVDHTHVARDRIEMTTAEKREVEAARVQFLTQGIADLKAFHRSVLKNKYTRIDYDALAREAMRWTAREVNTVTMFKIISVIGCANRQMARGRFKVDSFRSYSSIFHLVPKLRHQYLPAVMKSVLNAELDKGLLRAYPIGINYCSAIFGEGLAFQAKDWDDDQACRRHASLVIGRRPDPTRAGRCQYLIRNSWGTSCLDYHSDWDCDGPKGSVWIDADTLGRAVHDLETLRTIYD